MAESVACRKNRYRRYVERQQARDAQLHAENRRRIEQERRDMALRWSRPNALEILPLRTAVEQDTDFTKALMASGRDYSGYDVP